MSQLFYFIAKFFHFLTIKFCYFYKQIVVLKGVHGIFFLRSGSTWHCYKLIKPTPILHRNFHNRNIKVF